MSNIKYQYRTIPCHVDLLTTTLNTWGNKGWRVINFIPQRDITHTLIIFEKIIY